MFKLSFTRSDVVRSVWSFLLPFAIAFAAGVLGLTKEFLTSCEAGACDVGAAKAAGHALLIGTGSSILVALKNLVLSDASKLKG